MKKILIAIILFTAVFLFAGVPVYASDTETLVTLDDKANFTMELQSNALVFRNAPINTEIGSFFVILGDEGTYLNRNGIVRIATCTEGKSNGAVIDLSGLPDGIYSIVAGSFPADITEKIDNSNFAALK